MKGIKSQAANEFINDLINKLTYINQGMEDGVWSGCEGSQFKGFLIRLLLELQAFMNFIDNEEGALENR